MLWSDFPYIAGLRRLGWRHCDWYKSLYFLLVTFSFLQESVTSVFGCGLSAACIVDVGDEKTSICCVEDGLVIPSSR